MKNKFLSRIGQWHTPPYLRKCLTSLKALTLLLVMLMSVNVMAETKTLIIDGSQLTAATSEDTDLTYGDFTITMSTGAKQQASSGDNRFEGTSKAILIGKEGTYIYNKTPFGKITKFEIYANKGASAKVSVGVLFSTTAISEYATGTNTYTATLSTLDNVYDCSSKIPEGAQYFWYQVTNANNSQVMFRVTYEEGDDPTEPSLSVSPKTIDFGTVYQKADVDAQQVTVTFANLTADDVEANTNDLTTFDIDKYGPFTSGEKITITPNTYDLGNYEETLILFSEIDDLEERVTITMNVVEAPAPFEGKTLPFAFTSTPTGWPSAKASAAAGDYTYTLDGENYTFTHTKVGDGIYGSSYLMVVSGNALGLPAIAGYKLVRVDATNSSGCSTSVKVAIKEGPTTDDNDVTGGTAVTWSSTSSTYTYNLSGTADNTMYYLFVSSKNCQITGLTLYYQELPKVYSTITLATCENGSVNVTGATDLTSVASGTEITLGNTPADGYKLDAYDVYKTDESSTKVTITDGKFKMPAYGVTVSATFKEAKVLNSVEITTPASKTKYWIGEEFTSEGLVLTAHFASGDEVVTPTSITGYNMAAAGEQTVTVSFTEGATTKSDEYTITVKAIENTKETAYTVAEAITLIDANPTGLATAKVYVKGTISQVDNFNSTYKSITYWLDGNTFEVYSGKGLDNADFASINDVAVGAEVIVYGAIKKFTQSGKPDVYEFDKNNYLVSYVAPENPKTTATITLSGYVTSLSSDDAADEVTITYNGDGELSATSSNPAVATAAIVEDNLVVTPVAAGSTTITVSAPETDEYTAASKSYNLTVTAGLTPAALPFTFDGGKSDINPANGIKESGLNSTDYSSSPKLKFDGDGDYVIVKIASKAAQVSYKIKGAPGSGDWSGTFDVLESADGTAYTTVASHTTLGTSATTKTHDLLEDTRYVKFVLTTKANGNVGLGAINIVATKPKQDPEFSIANVDVVVEDMAALQITTNSDGAVTYTIEPNNEGIEIDGDVVYAYTEGTYTVTANKAETETYNAAQTTFTVSVSSVAYKTVEVSTFSAVNGGLLELGQFHSYKGEAGTAPIINNNHIRLYQIGSGKSSGGYITISALPGLKIAKIDISTATATSYNYKVDAAEDYTLTEATALAANATANIAGLSADSVRIYNMGADKNSRFDVSYLKVYYIGELETISALAVAGAEKTEYEIGDEVDHTGAVVTATFATAGDVDVTLNSTFTDPDMSTSGTKQVTANFAEQTATYDITVAAETPEITVDATAVSFGTVAQNAEVAAKTVAVTLKAIANAIVAVSGEGADAFNVTPASLTESGNITITPITTNAGEFAATITISADGAESKTISVTMNVTDGNLPKEKVDFTEVYSYVAEGGNADFTGYAGATFSIVAAKGEGSNVPKYYANGSSVRAYAENTITISSEKTIAFVLINYTSSKGQDDGKDRSVSPGNLVVNEKYGMWTLGAKEGTLTVGTTCSFDNIIVFYQYDEVVRTAQSENQIGTGCQTLDVVAVKGATLYQVNYTSSCYLEFMEVTYPVKAGMPIIMQADGTNDGKVEVIYGEKNPIATEGSDKDGLYGYIGADTYNIPNDEGYYVFKGGMLRPALDNYTTSGHAYIKLDEVPTEDQLAGSSAPRRRMSVGVERSMPTGFETIMMQKGMNKVIMNNQLFIIRDGKLFNAQGALVK